MCVLVKLINFSVEYECLQEQLLSSAVSLHQAELELHHNQLLHTITADLFSLHELENRSLLLLQDTQGEGGREGGGQVDGFCAVSPVPKCNVNILIKIDCWLCF